VTLAGRHALDLALNLARMPTLAPAMRAQPIPPDILVVIRLAAGCTDTLHDATKVTGIPADSIRNAAIFYLQEVLFSSEADSHRVLGVSPGASRREMREHMRWLLQWLHPDRNPNEWESVFAERVIKAWRSVGKHRPENRKSLYRGANQGNSDRLPLGANRWIALPVSPGARRNRRRFAYLFLLAALVIAVLLLPAIAPLAAR